MNDDNQINHLKAYGIVYYSLEVGLKAKWLLNYDGGAFLIENNKIIENECRSEERRVGKECRSRWSPYH